MPPGPIVKPGPGVIKPPAPITGSGRGTAAATQPPVSHPPSNFSAAQPQKVVAVPQGTLAKQFQNPLQSQLLLQNIENFTTLLLRTTEFSPALVMNVNRSLQEVSHEERLSSRSGDTSAEYKTELARHFAIVPQTYQKQTIKLVDLAPTAKDLKIIHDFLETYFHRLPESQRPIIVQQLIQKLNADGKLALRELIEQIFVQTAKREAARPQETRRETPAGEACQSAPSKRFEEQEVARPARPSSVPAFEEVIRTLSTEQPKEAHAWKQFFSQLMNTSRIRWSEIVAFVSVKANLLPKEAIKTLLNAAHHPKARVRATVLAVLKELTKGQALTELKKANELYFKTLAKLARDRESDKIKEEAIKILLEMGGRGEGEQKDRDMEALLREIDFYRTIEKLLKSRNMARLDLVHSLLLEAGRSVHAAKWEDFGKLILEIPNDPRFQEIRIKLLGLLLAYKRHLSNELEARLYRKPYDRLVRIASIAQSNNTKKPWDQFVGGQKKLAN